MACVFLNHSDVYKLMFADQKVNEINYGVFSIQGQNGDGDQHIPETLSEIVFN